MEIDLLVVLFIGFIGNCRTETLAEVEQQADEIVTDGTQNIPLQPDPRCKNGRCVLEIIVLKIPIVQAQLSGALDIGYSGGLENTISGKSIMTCTRQNGNKFSFGLTLEIDCEGEDQLKFRVKVDAGGTEIRKEVKGDLKKKLVPLCFPIPGLTVVSLCLYITEYKYDDVDKSMKLCMLIQLKVNFLAGVGFKIANLHNRCMFLRKQHFTQLNDKFKAVPSFTMRQANAMQQKLRSLSLKRSNSITGETLVNDIIPVDTPPAGK